MSLLGPGTKPLLAIVSTMLLLVAYTSGEETICPAISCETTISDFICYQHEADTPVRSIQTFSCPFD